MQTKKRKIVDRRASKSRKIRYKMISTHFLFLPLSYIFCI